MTSDWSPDGRFIAFSTDDPKTRGDVWLLPLSGDRKPVPLARGPFNESTPLFSPVGEWIAYVSNESGRNQVHVAPFPGTGDRWQVSSGGGRQPRWRRDGKEIFYLAPDDTLMVSSVTSVGGRFETGAERPLFRVDGISWYDVAADGQRFLVNKAADESATTPLTVVINWPATLKR